MAVGHRIELRQLQRQVQVQARVVGEARLARAGAPRVKGLTRCLMETGLVWLVTGDTCLPCLIIVHGLYNRTATG